MPNEISFEDTPVAEIDGDGKFKYVLIKLYKNKNTEDFKYIVRGFKWAGYHADIYEDFSEKTNFPTECVGGGRILHEKLVKTITVFGYSQAYGIADHEISGMILKHKFPDYKITWNDEGY